MNRLATVNSVVNEMTGEDFSYGELDCCLFAARVAEALTGKDYAASFHYESEEEADKIIKEHGGLDGLLTTLLGEPTTAPPRPGDVVLLDLAEPTVGVWYMRAPIVRTQKRFIEAPYSRITHTWSVG